MIRKEILRRKMKIAYMTLKTYLWYKRICRVNYGGKPFEERIRMHLRHNIIFEVVGMS